MPAMSASNWDATQWDSLVVAPGEPEADAIDRLRTIPELANIVGRSPDHISDAIESGKLQTTIQHPDQPFRTHTVSMRMWADYLAKEAK